MMETMMMTMPAPQQRQEEVPGHDGQGDGHASPSISEEDEEERKTFEEENDAAEADEGEDLDALAQSVLSLHPGETPSPGRGCAGVGTKYAFCEAAQDMSEAVSRLMNCASCSAVRDRVASFSGQKQASFFERLLDLAEGRMPEESGVDYEVRRRETANDHQMSFSKYLSAAYPVETAFADGDRLFRERQYAMACNAYADAVFAAEARPFGDVDRHFCELEPLETEEECCGPRVVVPSETPLARKTVPFAEIYLDLRMKHIECLLGNGQYRKASLYSSHALHWMATYKPTPAAGLGVGLGCVGYFAFTHADKFSLLQVWMGEAEVTLGNYARAIDGCSLAIKQFCELRAVSAIERFVFNMRQTFFERMIEHFEAEGGSDDEIAADRAAARIVVDEKSSARGVCNGQFVLNDLESALRIAKSGDVIFLEAGTYSPKAAPESGDASSVKKKKAAFEIRKSVTIVGCSTSKAIISGSLVKWGDGDVIFRRLKLEIGVDIDSDDDIYLMEGTTVLENCVVESPVNTCIYVISSGIQSETTLKVKHCIFDGLESCRRMICFQGARPIISVESCYISDMYSFCTVISRSEVSHAVVTVSDSCLYDVQDGLKMIVHHASNAVAYLIGCQIDLALRDVDASSHAFTLTGGSCKLKNNLIVSNNTDAIGYSLHSLRQAKIVMNLIETTSDLPRALALGEGIVLSENHDVVIENTEVVGMRVGFHISNQLEDVNRCLIRDCSAKSCALGVYVRNAAKNNSSSESPPAATSSSSTASPCARTCGSHSCCMPNQEITLSQCQFDTVHYGVMSDNPRAKIDILRCTFFDIPRPVLLSRDNLVHMYVMNNEFRLNPIYTEPDDKEGPALSEEAVRGRIYLNFATTENLPHRLAIDMNEFLQVGSKEEEDALHKKYRSFRDNSDSDEDE